MSRRKKKTVSLALGSGGARGLAHIGVIQWLESNGYEIRAIAGSSMGALIGGIHAMGKLDVYEKWVRAIDRTDVLRLLDLSFGGSGVFKGERIIDTLRELIGDADIQDLPIRFTAVATDVDEEKEIWLASGPLFDAIRASIAVPLVFTPHEIGGRMLLDGGLIDPVPIAPTLLEATDLTVAVNLGGRPEPGVGEPAELAAPSGAYEQMQRRIAEFVRQLQDRGGIGSAEQAGFLDLALRSIEVMQSTLARLKLASFAPDLVIHIPRNACGPHEFWRAAELIELGRRKTAAGMAALER